MATKHILKKKSLTKNQRMAQVLSEGGLKSVKKRTKPPSFTLK
jgi:hypothetical protein